MSILLGKLAFDHTLVYYTDHTDHKGTFKKSKGAYDMDIMHLWKRFLPVPKSIRNPTKCQRCNRAAVLSGVVTVDGSKVKFNLASSLNKATNTVPHCIDCLQQMNIPCAWCGKTILIGDPITLYSPKDPAFVPHQGAQLYSEDPVVYVGCLRWDCAITGADRAGFWAIPGEMYRVLSSMEQVIMGTTNNQSGIVIVSDLSDPNEAAPLQHPS